MNDSNSSNIKTIKDVLKETELILLEKISGVPYSYDTGWKNMNNILGGGIPFNTTVTIGARPSVGKSAFANVLALQMKKNNKFPFIILYWSFEMPAYQQGLRILSHELEISVIDLLNQNGLHNYNELINNQILQLEDLKIYFIDRPKTLSYMKNVIHKTKMGNKDYKIVNIIDHTRLVISDKPQIEEQKIFDLMQFSNETNKLYDCTNIILSQLNRKVEDAAMSVNNYRKPGQGDLFGADAIAQFSNIIITLHRPEMYNIHSYRRNVNNDSGLFIVEETKNKIFAEICKNREGELGTLVFNHNLKFNKIYE